MANYSIVINSRFKPFSYQELLAPALMSTQAHQQVEEAYARLADEADLIEGKLNEQTDPVAYARYKAYSDELNSLADRLAKSGLSPEDRRGMFSMRARYAKDIAPIEEAYARRRALAEEQRKMQMSASGDLRFDTDFATTSIDKLLENPELGYSTLNGANITQKASILAANYARGIVNNPAYSSILNGQYWQARQQAGYTPEQIIAEAMGDPNAPKELRAIRESIHNQLRDNAAYDRDWVDSYISQGFTSGIGQTQFSTMGDQSYLNAAQRQQMAFNAENQKWAREDRKEAKEQRYIEIGGTVYPLDTKTGVPYETKDGKKVLRTDLVPSSDNTKSGSAGSTGNSKSSSSSSSSSGGTDYVPRPKGPHKLTIQGKYNAPSGGRGHRITVSSYNPNNMVQSTPYASREKMTEDLGNKDDKNYLSTSTHTYNTLSPALQRYVESSIDNRDLEGSLYHVKQYKDGRVEVYIDPATNARDISSYDYTGNFDGFDPNTVPAIGN